VLIGEDGRAYGPTEVGILSPDGRDCEREHLALQLRAVVAGYQVAGVAVDAQGAAEALRLGAY
jgi:hypothetical protein